MYQTSQFIHSYFSVPSIKFNIVKIVSYAYERNGRVSLRSFNIQSFSNLKPIVHI